MKYLGIDFGLKRVGIAISDEQGVFSFPLIVLPNEENLEDKITKICEEKKIETIVIGESKDYKMKDNKIMEDVRRFSENLKIKTGLNVVFHPEFLTSAEAERIQGKNEMLDASAAAIILKSYLDLNNN